jgi:hypothetical protein
MGMLPRSATEIALSLQVAEALSKGKGAEFNARVVLGLLSPLLVVHSLPPHLFQDYMACIRNVLVRIEQWRLHSGPSGGEATLAGSSGSATWDTAASSCAASSSVKAASPSAPAANGGVGLGNTNKGDGALDEWGAFLGSNSPVAVRTSASSSQASLQSLGGASGGAKFGMGRSPMGRMADTSRAQNAASPSAVRGLGATTAATGELQGIRNGGAAAGALAALKIDPVALGGEAGRSALGVAEQQGPAAGKTDPFAELCMTQPTPKLANKNSVVQATVPVVAPVALAPNGSNGAAKGNTDDWGDWDPFS